MAVAVTARVLALLTDLADPLVLAALEVPLTPAQIHDGASEEEIRRTRQVQAIGLAFQALLRTPSLGVISDFDIVMALASVCGTTLAQVGEPDPLYRAFKAQFAAVLKEINEAQAARRVLQ